MKKRSEILKKYTKGIKRDTIAAALGIKPQYFSNIVNDKRKPSKKLLEKIVKLLNISDEDYNLLLEYESSLDKYKYCIIEKFSYETKLMDKSLEKIYSKKGDFFDHISNNNIIVKLKENLLEFSKNSILVFKKYENEDFDNRYIIIEDEIYKAKKIDKSILLEGINSKIVKKVDIKYILSFEIRRKDG